VIELRRGALSLVLIVLGDLLVGGAGLLPRPLRGGDVSAGDLLFFMVAAACWATYSVLARHHALDAVHAITITAFAFLLSADLQS
jgi:drug/metabolite transporter (DMT)-like permease